MYRTFNTKELVTKDLKLTSFDSLNDFEKEYFEKTFDIDDRQNVYCIGTSQNEDILYGYVRLVPNKITNSSLFPNLYTLSTTNFGDNKASRIFDINGCEIKDWCLETQFQNMELLKQFLSACYVILKAMNVDKLILWSEFNGSLYFYPIDFSDLFIDKKYISTIKEIFK